ncbi:MAG: TonB-dependent receptor [Tannerella sp.]|jgi:hypothetical protein|nr:TonB-dependent receptor [Tannerella sp.]
MKCFLNKLFLTAILFSLLSVSVTAQKYVQTIRGTVFEKNARESLPGANIVVQAGEKQWGAVSDEKGEFVVENVPVGRCHVRVSMIGFTPYVSNNLLVYSGKETVLEVALEENIQELDEVTVTPEIDKEQPLNRFAVVSARMLSSEEADRYAGSWSDPARMVANLAGVAAANDSRNDIIIRGNSPTGLLWRLDGFDIPNPNHFGALGGTGGPIGMLNNNQLANSDFYSGAFPAEFGNATSGVFDMQLRNGNNRKHEFLASMGFNGAELGAEGPLSKKTGASYMINGRYSFLEILEAMGVQIAGAGGAVPKYQDLCAKINLPLRRGNLSLITLLGANRIHQQPDMSDESPTDWAPGDQGADVTTRNRQLFTGVNHTHRFNTTTRLENRLSYQYFGQNLRQTMLAYPTQENVGEITGETTEGQLNYNASLHHRAGSRSSLQAGAGANLYMTGLKNVHRGTTLHDYDGQSVLLKAYAQWQYRFSDVLGMTPGVYGQLYTLNSDYSVEPRIGFKWDLSPASSLSWGGGLFSQLQPRQVYFYEENGVVKNKNLEMSKSAQIVLGYNQKLGKGMHLKTELYYQHLYNIPVIPDTPEESILNFGDDFYNSWDYIFVNEGTGRNYGIEMTLEKFFSRHYYFLLTASLYDSKYRGYDRVERNSKFAGNYAVNALAGYEWNVRSHLLSVNLKGACMGGKRFLPMTMEHEGLDVIYDYTQAYRQHLPAYFRVDLNVNMKCNYKRFSLEWYFEVNNLTNHQNVWMKYYNAGRQKEEFVYQYGFMPIGGCRIYF